MVDTDQKTPGRNDSCQPRWARLIIFLNKACVIEDSKNSGNGRYGNFPRALVWSLPSPNSNEQALHETKRCDITNDDEDVHFYSITKQINFSQLSKTPQFWQLLLSPFASARTSRSLVTDQHLNHFHRYVTGKHFKSAVYTLLKKDSQAPISLVKYPATKISGLRSHRYHG